VSAYKYTDATNAVVHVIDADGISRMSCLAETLPPDTVIEPADPLPPPVYTCSPWQIRKALNNLSLRQAVEDAVTASNDITLKDGWEFATEFRSSDPFVVSMGASLGMTEEQTTDLIRTAGAL
jgi:hypothetical protein